MPSIQTHDRRRSSDYDIQPRQGEVWMTDPCDINSLPFIMLPISKELGSQYAIERPQRM